MPLHIPLQRIISTVGFLHSYCSCFNAVLTNTASFAITQIPNYSHVYWKAFWILCLSQKQQTVLCIHSQFIFIFIPLACHCFTDHKYFFQHFQNNTFLDYRVIYQSSFSSQICQTVPILFSMLIWDGMNH